MLHDSLGDDHVDGTGIDDVRAVPRSHVLKRIGLNYRAEPSHSCGV
jgi:hypothetical protein